MERLLTPEVDRPIIFPIRHHDLWAIAKKMEGLQWVVEEIDLGEDLIDMRDVPEGIRQLLRTMLGFFAQGDGIVLRNLAENLTGQVEVLEAKRFYLEVAKNEGTHDETYAVTVGTFFGEGTEEWHQVAHAAENMPVVRAMARWADMYIAMGDEEAAAYGAPGAAFGLRMFAFALFEGCFFSVPFAAIQWLKKMDRFPGLTHANELIARDEGLHCDAACHLLKYWVDNRPPVAAVKDVANEARKLLHRFVDEAFGDGEVEPMPTREGRITTTPISATMMKQYVRFTMGTVVEAAGYKPEDVFDDEAPANPFPFMDNLALNKVGKTNFFERQTTAYQQLVGAPTWAPDTTPVEIPA